ncbi:MAG TPA: VOC family protein [Pseudonocardia sp.]|nr:VOC family protein [Pseudonocardia sp.]
MLDHIVLAAPDLAAAVAEFTELTGVEPAPGGQHLGVGTANYLVGLTSALPGADSAYLEIIGPDPEQPPPAAPRPFGIDDLTASRLAAWGIHPADLDRHIDTARERGYDPGPARAMSRAAPDGERLHWRLTWARLAGGVALVPFMIDWGSTPPPPGRGLPELELVSFEATHPAPDQVRPELAALDADLPVRAGNRAALTAVLTGRHGPVVLT